MIVDQAKLDELKALAEKAAQPPIVRVPHPCSVRCWRIGSAFSVQPGERCQECGWRGMTDPYEAGVEYVKSFPPTVALSLIAELERLRAELEVVRVIDAWAKKTCRNVPQIERGVRGEEWVMFVTIDGERAWFACKTPAETRAAAAKALLEEDPELDR